MRGSYSHHVDGFGDALAVMEHECNEEKKVAAAGAAVAGKKGKKGKKVLKKKAIKEKENAPPKQSTKDQAKPKKAKPKAVPAVPSLKLVMATSMVMPPPPRATATNPPPSPLVHTTEYTSLLEQLQQQQEQLLSKAALLLISEEKQLYLAKAKSDAEAQSILALRKCQTLTAELARQQSRAKAAVTLASKTSTHTTSLEEEYALLKQNHLVVINEKQEMAMRMQEITGRCAAAEVQLESEKDKNRTLKSSQNELKMALRKVTELKENGSYANTASSTATTAASPDSARSTATADSNLSSLHTLKNENAYLRKQTASEIQCKQELQKVVNEQTARLKLSRDTIAKLNAQVGELESLNSHHPSSSSSTLDPADPSIQTLQSNQESLAAELSNLKSSYAHSRENLALTQSALDAARASGATLSADHDLLTDTLQQKADEYKRLKREKHDIEELLRKKIEVTEAQVMTLTATQERTAKLTKLTNIMYDAATPAQSDAPLLLSVFSSWKNNLYATKIATLLSTIFEMEKASSSKTDEMEELKNNLSTKYNNESSTAINTARKQASEYVKKVKLESETTSSSLSKELDTLRVKCAELSRKLSTAGDDHSIMKKRILELTAQVKQTKEDGEKELACQLLRATRAADNSTQQTFSQLTLEKDRCLLNLEKELRKEFQDEIKQLGDEKKAEIASASKSIGDEWRDRVSEVEKRLHSEVERVTQAINVARDAELKNECARVAQEAEKKTKGEVEEVWRGLLKGAEEAARRDVKVLVEEAGQKREERYNLRFDAAVLELEEKAASQLKEAKESYDLQLAHVRETGVEQLRVAVGEERARSVRMIENARNDCLSDQQKRHGEELAAIVDRHRKHLVELENKWMAKVEELEATVVELEKGRKEGVKKEAEKWEKVVEECESARIEQVRELQCSGREEAESGRRQITDAAKKAIEEARRRYNVLREEYEKCKEKLVEMEGGWKKKEVSWKKKAGVLADKIKELQREEVVRKEREDTVVAEVVVLTGRLSKAEESAAEIEGVLVEERMGSERMREEKERVEKEGVLLVAETREMIKGMVAKDELEGVRGELEESKGALERERVDRGELEKAMGKLSDQWKDRARVWDERSRGLERELKEKERDLREAGGGLARAREEGMRVGEEQGRREGEKRKEEAVLEIAGRVEKEFGERALREKKEWEGRFGAVVRELAEEKVAGEGRLGGVRREGREEVERLERKMGEIKREGERAVEEMAREMKEKGEKLRAMEGVVGELKEVLASADSCSDGAGDGAGDGASEEDLYGIKVGELKKNVDKGKEIEQYVRETEASLKEFNNSKSGTLSPGGGFNIGNVKKGRRLNEELEDGLRLVEGNRRVVKGLQREIGEINERRRVAEKERAGREREKRVRVEELLERVRGIVD